jgi:hypothetical protein
MASRAPGAACLLAGLTCPVATAAYDPWWEVGMLVIKELLFDRGSAAGTQARWEDQMDGRERFLGCLLGLAVGDAVGTAVEFKPRGSFTPITDLVGGGPFRLRPGQWTDDTSMALCLASSLVETGGFDPADQRLGRSDMSTRVEDSAEQRTLEDDVDDDLEPAHLDWRDIPPPRDLVRARREGHVVRIPKPTIVIDSGESRCGYRFERFARWIAGTEQRRLEVGDYSIRGLERSIAIERKAPGDAVSSVMPPLRAPFLERCARMAKYRRKAIVIEASYAVMRSSYEEFTESVAHPNAVVGSYLAIQERWGMPVYFIDTPELAEECVAHMLTKFYVRHWLRKAGLGDHFQDGDI